MFGLEAVFCIITRPIAVETSYQTYIFWDSIRSDVVSMNIRYWSIQIYFVFLTILLLFLLLSLFFEELIAVC